MRRRVTVLLLGSLGVVGAVAPSASASAKESKGSCIAQFTSNQEAGQVGATISFLAPEEQPFGQTIVAFSPGLKPPCEPE